MGIFKNIRWHGIVSVLVIIGFLVLSVLLFYRSEHTIDFSRVAEAAIPVTSTGSAVFADGTLVSITGPLDVKNYLGDDLFLHPGPYLILKRVAEMYSWKEEIIPAHDPSSGEAAVFEYYKDWSTKPPESKNFRKPDGHGNPPMKVQGATLYNTHVVVDGYFLDPERMVLPLPVNLPLTPDMVALENSGEEIYESSSGSLFTHSSDIGSGALLQVSSTGALLREVRLEGKYLYVGKGSDISPQVGDMRIHYEMIKSGEFVTAFGGLFGNVLKPFIFNDKDALSVLARGDREAAIFGMKVDYHVEQNIWRAFAIMIIWIAFQQILGEDTLLKQIKHKAIFQLVCISILSIVIILCIQFL